MLRLVLPKGSLERPTLELFDAADLAVRRSSIVDYRGNVDDPRIDEVRILRPQEIPSYVAEGLFDLGITGRDWIEETGSEVISLGELAYSKATPNPVRVVLAVAEGSTAASVRDLAALPGHRRRPRVSTEYPRLTARFLASHRVDADVRLSYGATEAKIPDVADAVVEITETGRALHAAGLRILETVLVSRTELIANPASAAEPAKLAAMHQLRTLLQGALEARGQVLVKLNVSAAGFEGVLAVLPAARTPTVSALHGEDGYAVEAVVPKARINIVIPALKDAGATDILELALAKIVH